MADDTPRIDMTKIRIGYAVVGAMVLAAIVAAVVIDNTSGRVLFGLVALFGVYRFVRLQRSLRTPPAP